MKKLTELQPLIQNWAKDKNLNDPEKQRLKLLSEVGELADAILKNDVHGIKDGIGDTFVVLIILANQTGTKIKLDDFKPSKIVNVFDALLIDILNRQSLRMSVDFLNDIAIHLGYGLTECANIAWNEIKDRTGVTVGGTFIKD